MSDHPPPPIPKVSVGRRLIARLVDGAVLFIPVLLVGAVLGDGYEIGSGNDTARQFAATLVGVLLTFAYFVVMESSSGATLGKRALGIRVGQVDDPTAVLTPVQAAKRNAFVLLSAIPTGIGGIIAFGTAIGVGATASADRRGQGFHDKWAGALVSSDR